MAEKSKGRPADLDLTFRSFRLRIRNMRRLTKLILALAALIGAISTLLALIFSHIG